MGKNRLQRPEYCPFVGKGGLKLQFALEHFALNLANCAAADLGCHIGGFSDCLLQNGASRVYAVDTAYGLFDWKLRNDPRVTLYERTNALYWEPPEALDWVIIDLGWTVQGKSLVKAAGMLKPGGGVLSLVKPQYEVPRDWLEKGVLAENRLAEALAITEKSLPDSLNLIGRVKSPYQGGGGNVEFWFHLVKR